MGYLPPVHAENSYMFIRQVDQKLLLPAHRLHKASLGIKLQRPYMGLEEGNTQNPIHGNRFSKKVADDAPTKLGVIIGKGLHVDEYA